MASSIQSVGNTQQRASRILPELAGQVGDREDKLIRPFQLVKFGLDSINTA